MEPAFEPPEDEVAFDVAPTSARVIARAIDLVMIVATATLIVVVLVAIGSIDSEELENPTGQSDTFILFSFLGAALLYEVSLSTLRGKTLGKMVTRSKLISTTSDRPPQLWSAMIRVAVWLIPVLLLDVIGLAITFAVFSWAFFDQNRQGLHDKLASTYVVVDHPVPPRSGPGNSG